MTALPKPEVGLVIHFSYLWHNQFLDGIVEGTKNRPCLIIAIDGQKVFVCPVTHSPRNFDDIAAFELPKQVKEHLNLDDERSWVVLEEYNCFNWTGYDLRRNSQGYFEYGLIPPALFENILQKAQQLSQKGVGRD